MLSVLFHSLHRCSLNFALLLSALFKFSLFLVCSFSFLLLFCFVRSFFLSFFPFSRFLLFFPALISFSLFRKKDRNRELVFFIRFILISLFLKFDFLFFLNIQVCSLSSCLLRRIICFGYFLFYRLSPVFAASPTISTVHFPPSDLIPLLFSSRFLFSNLFLSLSFSLVIRFSACIRDRMELTF